MADWTPPAEPVTWTFPAPVQLGSVTYTTVTLRAPTGADILKATAVSGEGSYQATLRLIAIVSSEAIPFEALILAPAWQIDQMSRYLDSFNGAPLPLPLRPVVPPSAAAL